VPKIDSHFAARILNLKFAKLIPNRIRKSQLALGTFFMCCGQGIKTVTQAVYFILIARALGSQGYGAFVSVVSLVAVISPFVALGAGNLLIKNVARFPDSFRLHWGKAVTLVLLTGTTFTLVAAPVANCILPEAITLQLIVTVCIADLIFIRLTDTAAQAFLSVQKVGIASILMFIPNLNRLILLVLSMIFFDAIDIILWGYVYLTASIITASFAYWCVCNKLGGPCFARSSLFAEMSEGCYFSISVSSQNIYNDIDKVILSRLANLEVTGIYSAAYRIIDVLFVPIRSLMQAACARFFQVGMTGIHGSVALTKKILPYALCYSVGAGIFIIIVSPLIPLIIGIEYLMIVPVIRMLSILPLFKVLQYFASDALTGAGYQRVRTVCQVVVAVINISLLLWLVPAYSWRGAVWASLASDFILAVVLWCVIHAISTKTRLERQ
jgi:O-antigen/teichoic acid export membrane protein